jgi:hypothetical protein
LADSDRAQGIEIAYRNVCGLLQDMRAMAASLGKDIKLDQLIIQAADKEANLRVDPNPRLVILHGNDARKIGSWAPHEYKLRETLRITCLVFQKEPYTFRRPEMKS